MNLVQCVDVTCSVAENERKVAAIAAKEAADLRAQLLRPASGVRPRSAAVRWATTLLCELNNVLLCAEPSTRLESPRTCAGGHPAHAHTAAESCALCRFGLQR